MKLRSTAAALVVLAGTTMWAQSAPGAGRPRTVVATSNSMGVAENARALASARQRMEEMGNTLSKMHALLKEMQAKTASKDLAAKANLEMWSLMLGDLDKQYQQMQIATHAREDLEARRAAMYKQAEDRAAAAAKSARESGSAPAAGTSAAQPSTTQAPASSPN